MGNIFQISALSALLVNLVLGFLVLGMNPRRRANRYFLVASSAFSAYAACLAFGAFARSSEMMVFWVQQSSVTSALLPAVFDLLRLAIMQSEDRRGLIGRQLWPWVFLTILVTLLCQMPFFVTGIELSPTGFPKPVYGSGRIFYVAYWVIALGLMGNRYRHALFHSQGIQRAELEFTVMAFVSSAIFGLGLAQVVPLLTGVQEVTQFLPLAIIVLDAVLAYGIVTRRIMSVGDVLRRLTAYVLLTLYLVFLYLAAHKLGTALLAWMGWTDTEAIVAMVSALAVAFSMAPAHGRMQQVANRLFVSMRSMDIRDTMQKANQALMSIGTIDELMQRFSGIVMEATGSDRLHMFLWEDGGFRQAYPLPEGDGEARLASGDPLVRMLRESREAVGVDSLRRMRVSDLRLGARARLEQFQAAVGVGVFAKEKMEGVLLLGPRLSGRIYGVLEQEALQLLCNQLGVALENARLYTESQNSRIYNDILVDSLVSGVVAVNAERKVTVFNRAAQRITGLAAEDVLGRSLDALPQPLNAASAATLGGEDALMHADMDIAAPSGETAPIRLSSSRFQGHTGELMGALTVFDDMTALHKLEEQVRRTDRLASLGTLAAGMAHEIKNPLVSIKTFTQLLPERYEDREFRETFFELIGQEVRRIDTLVSQLLHFSRPEKPSLAAMGLHEAVDATLRLLDQQLRSHDIRLVRELDAARDAVMGDAHQINQALVNLLLNAIEAMDRGGTLTVCTVVVEQGASPRDGRGARRDAVKLSICDTGRGIPAEDLPRVFDPFFTTKPRGTGLGLAVTHRIIEEHGGTIDVEAEVGKGTVFHLQFPLKEDPIA